MISKLIILDRDGVINEDSDAYIKTPDEFIPIPGSLKAIAQLNQAGYTVVIATNQSGIARGFYNEQTLHDIHNKLEQLLMKQGGRVDRIYFCPHGPSDNCNCRKPKPGLMQQILADYAISNHNVISIGDSLRDLQASAAVGIQSILVRTGKGRITEQQLTGYPALAPLGVYDNLASAVTDLLK